MTPAQTEVQKEKWTGVAEHRMQVPRLQSMLLSFHFGEQDSFLSQDFPSTVV